MLVCWQRKTLKLTLCAIGRRKSIPECQKHLHFKTSLPPIWCIKWIATYSLCFVIMPWKPRNRSCKFDLSSHYSFPAQFSNLHEKDLLCPYLKLFLDFLCEDMLLHSWRIFQYTSTDLLRNTGTELAHAVMNHGRGYHFTLWASLFLRTFQPLPLFFGLLPSNLSIRRRW